MTAPEARGPSPTLAPFPPRARPVGTYATLAVIVPVSIAAFVLPSDVLLARLAKDNEAILAGEVWRLVTIGLVHGSWLHLGMNAYFLWDLGRFVELWFGTPRFLAVLWGGVAAGSVASLLATPAPSVGVSGGLFALVGALLSQGLRHWRQLAPAGRRLFLRAPIGIVVLNVLLGLVLPFVDNAGHLGGLAGGLALGALLGFRPDVQARLAAARPRG